MPTFFDVMVHLAIHLANEAKLGGPAQFRWMYYIEEILTKENNRNVAKRHKEELPLWFEKKVIELKENGDNRITEELLILARPPDPRFFCYSGYILNDSRFRTMESELGLKTQNSGVVVKSDEHTGNVDYFGRIRRILEIQYMNNKSVILFQCDWFEVPPQGCSQSTGSQAQSVYYVKHGQSEKWHSVIRVRPRNLYDLPEQKDEMEPYQLIELVEKGETNQEVELENDNIRIEREDIDGVSVEATSFNNEEEVDLVVADEPDHENVDDFNDFAIDEDTSEYDEVEDDDWF
ncbi:hypothetical protein KY289_008261 [Solanum tuberosum]|nr:hypothetical protein KY289_008261 [Solanum tuberosum]